MIYLDWAATAIPKNKIIIESTKEGLKLYGNPSSTHKQGVSAKNVLENCRERCGKLLGAESDSLYFTSGASESNSIAILSFLKRHSSGEIITTSIEHPSVLEPIDQLKKFGYKVHIVNPKESGLLNLKKLEKSINTQTKLISIIYVHNETGVIQPIDEIIEIIRKKELEFDRKIHIHLDGVQAVGKIPVNIESLNVDSFSISGHKFGAPKGIGILYLRKSREVLIKGGGQERGIRPGTENLIQILSITNCLEDTLINFENKYEELNRVLDRVINGVRSIGINTIPKTRLLSDSNFVPNILSLTAPPIGGEVLARILDNDDISISTGSACSNNKKSTTKGILSMGITKDEGFSSFRISIGITTKDNDIDLFLEKTKVALSKFTI
ncbi:MAG: hypothetical protein B6229_01455 [Spirochaetaceae bacterium 4572_7]|nr:MAG: hypothetical protein B6229_01455 [Spirochaetaceae bacterium 4572_7]